MEADNGFNMGRASEITRDELKFSKFVNRLRLRFSHLFDKLLETQLLLKGICTRKEWQQMKEEIFYDYQSDLHFAELKGAEILKERLGLLEAIDPFVGKYFSIRHIRNKVLQQSEEDIKELDKEMEEEAAQQEETAPPEEEQAQQEAPPPAPTSHQVNIKVKGEEYERDFDDSDQKELSKSMTRFFDTLVEEARGDNKE
jgi:hypothetical protein